MEKVIQVNLASQLDLILFQLHDGVGVLRLAPAAARSPLGPRNPCELDLLPSQGSNKLSPSSPSPELPSGYLTVRHGIDGP